MSTKGHTINDLRGAGAKFRGKNYGLPTWGKNEWPFPWKKLPLLLSKNNEQPLLQEGKLNSRLQREKKLNHLWPNQGCPQAVTHIAIALSTLISCYLLFEPTCAYCTVGSYVIVRPSLKIMVLAGGLTSTSSCFIYGLGGFKGPLLVWTNHINNEICMKHCFLATLPYLCSTSLTLSSIETTLGVIIIICNKIQDSFDCFSS